ncbi:dTDP-glucose 4,6-dehydratase [Marispirochaeta sp.]|jgi:dTDP-glucose 4,6-dehydratase|uniref:dTDP-glucose 4,6-dehydratase n=1 Tax=Marispirochaeta sp. TaxID=2038653 RepID=UPI0029C757D6|nr:dTDP-glucose 4,6-dehydratase [Marispirochaeta sp.]
MRLLKSILVTGGAGFIGVNFIRHLFEKAGFDGTLINLDILTYAGNPASLADIQEKYSDRYNFVRGDIRDRKTVDRIFNEFNIDTVVHFAAESHVDRSILGPEAFITTNVMGTFTLLEASRTFWNGREGVLFHHVSTDEVYGSLGDEGCFTEASPYDPRSPYSASKAGSDHLVQAYHHTYGLPVTLSNCSNNYGPYQFPEKLIPLMIMNMLEGKPLPVYGDGKNIRDWLYVEDHAAAVWNIISSAPAGESFNVGGENEWENITLLERLIEIVAARSGKDPAAIRETITFVKDRPGHDRRYAIDCGKIKKELGWRQSVSFEEGLARTVDWYLDNPGWTESIRSGEYQDWIARNYGGR